MAAVLGLALLTSCTGDNSHEIIFVNSTDIPVVVYGNGRAYPGIKKELAPGERWRNDAYTGSGASSAFVSQVEATSLDGTLIYCHPFRVSDLDAVNWQVEIRAGEIKTSCR